MVEVLVKCLRKDNDIVQIDETGLPAEAGEDNIKGSLKRRGRGTQSKEHPVVLEHPAVADQRGLVYVRFVHIQLPVATICV